MVQDRRGLNLKLIGLDLLIWHVYFPHNICSIIGRIFEGEDVVRRMCKQPNKGPNGFIKSPADYIKILSLELMESYS